MKQLIKDIFTLDLSDRRGLPDLKWETFEELKAGAVDAKRGAIVGLTRELAYNVYIFLPVFISVVGATNKIWRSEAVSFVLFASLLLASLLMLLATWKRLMPEASHVATGYDFVEAIITMRETATALILSCGLYSIAGFYSEFASPLILNAFLAASVVFGLAAAWKAIETAVHWRKATNGFLMDDTWSLMVLHLSIKKKLDEAETAPQTESLRHPATSRAATERKDRAATISDR